MNRIVVCCLLSVSCTTGTEDYSWFEGDWISNSALKMEANPHFLELDEESIDRLSQIFGKLRWSVTNRLLTVDHGMSNSEEWQVSFTIRPIDESRFELLSKGGNSTVWKTEHGFCNEPETYGPNPVVIECFSPAGT